MTGPASGLRVDWLGRVDYAAGLELQAKAVEARQSGASGDRLMLLEHPPVVTLGRAAHESNLLLSREALASQGIAVHEVPRGGDVTYHAPGQLVGYLVADLHARGERDLHFFLRRMESALIEGLAGLGLRARSVSGRTGVFMEAGAGEQGFPERKIASIGVGVRRWVTFHGFALNVDPDLSWFRRINPCGLGAEVMTSMRALGVEEVDVTQLRTQLAAEVADLFGRRLGAL